MDSQGTTSSVFNYWLLDQLEVRLLVADTVTIDKAWWCSDGKSAFWRLYYHDRNGATLNLQGVRHALRAGRIYILPAGQRLDGQCRGKVQQFFVHFNVTGLPDLALRTLFHDLLCLPPDVALKKSVKQLAQELGAAPGEMAPNAFQLDIGSRQNISIAVQWRLKALIYQALAQCLKNASDAQLAQCWQFAHGVRSLVPALRFIEENLGVSINNRLLAQICGFNEDYFIRAFSAAMKQTPAQFIRERRINEASDRLLFSTQSIDEMARALGFCDRAHFSRVFKQQKGTAPALFRSRNCEETTVSI